jgi:type I restriction enzyme S subunit
MSQAVAAVHEVREPSAKYLVQGAEQTQPLVQHFNLLATSPGGVARLRELILTLAVQGKLVPQDPSDEPASELLKKIRAEKDRLIAEGKIKRDKPLAEIAEDEKPFGLPVGWEFCRLGDLLLSIRSGGTPSKQNPAYWDGEIPWASVKDLRFGEPLTNTQDRITQAGLDAGSELAPAGSILICTRMGLGKIGEARIDVAINQDLKAVVLGSGVDKQYFINYFKTLAVVGSGMTVAGIKQDELLAFLVPLPPETEQSRIVARVEELMRLCDALEAKGKLEAEQHARLVNTLLGTLTQSDSPEALAESWQRVAAHFDLLLDRPEAVDALEQTILQLAVRGLLVPQDPNDEPASELLKKIRAEKDQLIAQGKIKRDKPLPPIAEDEKPFELPVGWEWARFPELGQFGRGKSKHRPRNDPALFNPPIYPIVQTGEVARAKGVIQEIHSKYSEVGLAQSRLWPKGTLCITIAANIADAALLGFDACFPDSVVGFIPANAIGDANYFLAFMETARTQLIAYAPATAQKNINLEILESVLIPIPPAAEMSRIVTRVNELRRLCADLRHRLSAQQKLQAQLAEALTNDIN